MKTIIVGTDFSKDANDAVNYAAALTAAIGGKLVLFNSFTVPASSANARLNVNSYQSIIDKTYALLNTVADGLRQTYTIEVITELGMSDVQTGLDELVLKYDGRLVVMGMRGDSMEQKFFGNNTTAMMNHGKFPVLAVPHQVQFSGLKRILFAYDEQYAFTAAALNTLENIVSGISAEIELFNVKTKADEPDQAAARHTEQIRETFKNITHTFREVSGTEVMSLIRNEVAAFNADLLVMIPQHYQFWKALLHSSKSRAMAASSGVPFLSIPDNFTA